jgi:LCP family protein required for cell wall assembly
LKPQAPVLIAIAVGLGLGLGLAAPMAALLRGDATEGAEGRTPIANPFSGWVEGNGEDLLVLGTDEGGGNTDVISLVRIEGGVTRVLQIPRDSYLETERWGPIKINALYSLGGEEALKRELSQRMGNPIHHHVIVNLAALRHLADLVGGIEVNVPKRLYYVDNSQGLMIDLQPGRQTLKGRQLEGFLRFRHDDSGDIGRLQRQQLALQGLFHKLGRPESMVRLPSLLMATSKEIRTDLGPMELGGLMTAMGSTKLETQRLKGHPFDRNGISYWDTEWPVPQEHAGLSSSTTGSGRGPLPQLFGDGKERPARQGYRYLY